MLRSWVLGQIVRVQVISNAGQSKIAHFSYSFSRDEDVIAGQITMDDVMRVEICKC